jgi:hypothetical protein
MKTKIDLLPTFDPTWSDEIKKKWFETYLAILRIEIKKKV